MDVSHCTTCATLLVSYCVNDGSQPASDCYSSWLVDRVINSTRCVKRVEKRQTVTRAKCVSFQTIHLVLRIYRLQPITLQQHHVDTSQELQLMFTNARMKEKVTDLSDFDFGLVVGPRWVQLGQFEHPRHWACQKAQYAKPYGRWVTMADGHIRFHCCQSRTGIWVYTRHKISKTGLWKTGEACPDLLLISAMTRAW